MVVGLFGLVPFRSGYFCLGPFGPILGGSFWPYYGGLFRSTLFHIDI